MTTIFFDLDGTLLNTQAGIAESIRIALGQLDRTSVSDEELKACFGPPIRESFARLLSTDKPELIVRAVTLFRQHYLNEGIYNYQIYPGIEALLQQISELTEQQISLRVLTVKPRFQAEKLLQHSELMPFFDSVHGSENCGKNSNKTEHLAAILKQNSGLKDSCWMVGDRASDIQAAKANQAISVAVHWGYGEADELNTADSDHSICEPEELLRLL